jgi:electron transfer flavoprotein alpha subunit
MTEIHQPEHSVTHAPVAPGTERDGHTGVWFFPEHKAGKLEDVSFLLAGEGRSVADKLQQELSAVIVGYPVRDFPASLGPYGVDKALVVEEQSLENCTSDAYVDVLAQLAESNKPSIILFTATPMSNDLAPRLAARLRVGIVAHYTEIELDKEGRLIAHRPIHRGKARATVAPLKMPMIATVDPQSLSPQKARAARSTLVIRPSVRVNPRIDRVKVIDFLKADPCAVCVSEAEIVIGVGKGMSCAENLAAVETLAQVLGGSIGGSRRATDERWIPDERRIGLTGKTICPRLYLMCGISGAFHHTLSIKQSQLILSINTDRTAPITKMADLAVLGDMQEIVPELTKQLRDTIGQTAPHR